MRHVDFSPLYRSTVGFDRLFSMLDGLGQPEQAQSYPPYNIEQTSSDGLRITLAVAGFGSDELSVQIEDSQLVIRGRQIEEDDRIYLHRGIAARQFLRTFVLAEGIEVVSADLDNGLLHIDLRRPMPEVKVQTIEINAGKKPASRVSAKKLDVERAD